MSSIINGLIILNFLTCSILLIAYFALSQFVDDISSRLSALERVIFALPDKEQSLSKIKKEKELLQENKESELNWHGLSQTEIDEVKRVDDSKMIDGVPVLGKGVYNPMTDPAAQLKGDVCHSYYN